VVRLFPILIPHLVPALGLARAVTLAISVVAFAADAHAGDTPVAVSAWRPCPWVVRGTRPATPKELAFQDPNPLLRKPENPNYAPGPEGAAAVVETDREHFRHLFLEDPLTGSSTELAFGSEPRWSPDGKWIAFTGWKSAERPSMFCLVDPATGKISEPEEGVAAEEYAWSPDGLLIAVAGRRWSDDEPTDIWLVELDGGVCRLTETPAVDEGAPRWLDDRRILYSAKRDRTDRRWRVLTLERREKAESVGIAE